MMNREFKISQRTNNIKRLRFLAGAYETARQHQKSTIITHLSKVMKKLRGFVSANRLRHILGPSLCGMLLLGMSDVQAQNFGPPVKIDVPEVVEHLGPDLADMDQDGDLDLVFTHFLEYDFIGAGYFENVGDQNEFALADSFTDIELDTSMGPEIFVTLDMEDMDGDGDLDLNSGTITDLDYYEIDYAYAENLGAGQFSYQFVRIPDSDQVVGSDASFVDYDDDGDIDILLLGIDLDAYIYVGESKLGLGYIENIGNSQEPQWAEMELFEEFPDIEALSIVQISELADFDGDGDLDMVVSQYLDDEDEYKYIFDVFYFENTGTGFSEPTEIRIFDEQFGLPVLTSGDLDGDGDVDLLFSLYEDNGASEFAQVYWFENLNITSTKAEPSALNEFKLSTQLVNQHLALQYDLQDHGDFEISIIDAAGRSIQHNIVNPTILSDSHKLHVSTLKPGTYFTVIRTENTVKTLQFTKI